jgi:hypothetical protein
MRGVLEKVFLKRRCNRTMFKRKTLWIIPLIVALVAVIGVGAIPSLMLGVDQNEVALAVGADGDQVVGQIVESNAEEQNRGETWHWIVSSEQGRMANEVLGENPNLTVGEMLENIAPDVLQRLVQDLGSNSPIKHLFDPEFKWRPGMVEKISFHADPDGTGGAMAIGTKDMVALFGAAAEKELEKGVPTNLEESAVPMGIPSNPRVYSDIHPFNYPYHYNIGFDSWTSTAEIWPYLWVQTSLQRRLFWIFYTTWVNGPQVVAYNACYVYSWGIYDCREIGLGHTWKTLGHHLSIWNLVPFEQFSHSRAVKV